MDVYPSADDKMNLFNAEPGVGRGLWALAHPDEDGKDPYTYINTVAEPGEVLEYDYLKKVAFAVIQLYLEKIGFNFINEKGHLQFDRAPSHFATAEHLP